MLKNTSVIGHDFRFTYFRPLQNASGKAEITFDEDMLTDCVQRMVMGMGMGMGMVTVMEMVGMIIMAFVC